MKEEEFVDYVKTLHEQNLNGREDFLQAFEKGIRAAYEELQQSEVDHECKYCGAMTTEPDEYCYRNPNSKEKQPEQGDVDLIKEAEDVKRALSHWNDKEFVGNPKGHNLKGMRPMIIANRLLDKIIEGKSTLTQDKEREIAQDYARFAIECDRKGMPILEFQDWIKL